jgi:predicted RNA-binding Zn-ribbon protein involved in translation (DUF1610 family)
MYSLFTCWTCSGTIPLEKIVDIQIGGGCLGADFYGICPRCGQDSMFRDEKIRMKGRERMNHMKSLI